MNRTQPDCQVLVVGAGPTGLVLAAELLARGIHTRIIDKGDGAVLQTRAIGIQARALEVLDMMGLADRFVERGQVVPHFRFYSSGKCLIELDFAHSGSKFGFLLNLPQDQTERLLRERVAELGGAIEQGTELTGLCAGPHAVSATIRDRAGQVQTVTAGYVVGCDGAHSRVRRELGLSFHGHPYPQDWLLADVLIDAGLAEHASHVFFQPNGLPIIFFPMRGHRWRLTLPFAGGREDTAPGLAEIQELTNERAPWPVTVSDPTWLANFRCHRRSASAYRVGRVLLAGDAVHIHTPAGGQGMNTGIIDAHNLAWKLALVAGGQVPDTLLDSYGTERRPVAEQVLKLTHTLVRYGTMSHPIKRRARDLVIPLLARSTAVQRRAVRRLTHVGMAYPPDRQRMPDIPVLAQGQPITLHATLRAGRHVLIVPVPGSERMLADPELRRYGALLDAVTTDPSQTPRLPNARRGAIFLVRPDGHTAACGALPEVTGYLRGLFGSPVPAASPGGLGEAAEPPAATAAVPAAAPGIATAGTVPLTAGSTRRSLPVAQCPAICGRARVR